ncbi:MAG: NUDIX hydrolase [Burkholderiales bacterium]|nr:MAG: NUDIX hydrolase [Burkholderiales bacterium]
MGREKAIASRLVHDEGFLRLRKDTVELADGRTSTREVIEHPGAACIVPLFGDGRVLVERQYRYPVDATLLELPAGKIDRGESPLVTARRELEEETGYRALEWAHLTTIYPCVGYSDERIEFFVARALEPGNRALEHGEHVEVEVMALSALLDAVHRGQVPDSKSQIGILWLERLVEGAWPWPAFERV